MKTGKFVLLLIVAVLCLSLAGCKKTKDAGNHFTYAGKDYALTNGLLEYYGAGNGSGYNFDVTLYSSGISYSETDQTLTGTGHILYIEMYSSQTGYLESGSYTFDSGSNGNSGTYTYGAIGMDVNMQAETGTIKEFTSVNVKIVKSGTTYEVSFAGKDTENTAIDAYFKGTFTFADYTAMALPKEKIYKRIK